MSEATNMKAENINLEPAVSADVKQKNAAKKFNELRDRPQIKKPLIQRLAENLAVRIALGTALAGTVAFEAYENIPAVHQAIEQRLNPSSPEVPSTFDRTATEGIIGANNMVQITPQEYANVGPQLIENGYMNIPLPVAFKDGQMRTIEYKIEKGNFQGLDDYNLIITLKGLVAGDVFLSPIDGEIEIFQGSGDLQSFNISSADDQGKEVRIFCATAGLTPLIELESTGVTHRALKRGEPIGTLKTSDKTSRFDGQVQMRGIAFGKLPATLAATPEGKAIDLVIQ